MIESLLPLFALLPFLAPTLPVQDEEPTEDPGYFTVTNSRRSVTNFNIETIRGMAWDAGQGRLYAVNTHGSTLVYFDSSVTPPAVAPPTAIFRTINNPTALALWDNAQGRKFAIVVGGGTHGLVKHDRNTGEIVGYLDLPAEPKDIVVDTENDWAWVSCAGAFDKPGTIPQRSGGVVMKIDLNNFTPTGGSPLHPGAHFIDAVRPTFLNIEIVPGDTENTVYVAPLLSGNRTTHDNDGIALDKRVVTVTGLPDDDLFAIDESGNVSVVAQGVGTLMTNHARNPASGKYWMLNVKSLNAAQNTEAKHRGRFALNELTQANVPQTATPFKQDFPLDGTTAPNGPLGVAGANKPASFPFGLAIHSTGLAAVVSSTGDTIRMIDGTDPGGAISTIRNVGLPTGSIPRGALLSPDGSTLWVYAWGTNRILQYYAPDLVLPTTTSVNPLLYDLGVDPLPAAAKHGREIWYDADNSEDKHVTPSVPGKVSCNTCHPAGATDMLGWELTDPPLDRKDVMVTQSLLGIEDTFPYHWRGERSLSDFNGAFQFLLGGSQLAPDDLADFEAFVFSLQGAANPRQHPARELRVGAEHVVHDGQFTGSPIVGQQIFHQQPGTLLAFGGASCIDCHGAETGTNGQITLDNATAIPSNTNIDVAHLRQLQHKFFQPIYSTPLGDRPRGGWGFSQDGDDNDIVEFFNPAIFFGISQQDAQDRVDVASFMLQFDEGIAPRAHDGVYYAQNSTAAQLSAASALIAQAQAGNCDLAGIGHYLSGGTPNLELRLWFDTSANVFRTSEAGTGFAFDVPTMESLRANNYIRMVMVGLPPGNAYRFAVDPDDDGLSFLTEANFSSINLPNAKLDPWRADTDGDGYPDGYELTLYHQPPGPVSTQPDPVRFDNASVINATDNTPPTMGGSAQLGFVSARQSKHLVSFNEPVTYDVQVQRWNPSTVMWDDLGPLQRRPSLRRMDTLIAHHLQPSVDFTSGSTQFVRDDLYRLKVIMDDLADNLQVVEYVGPANGFRSDDNVFLPPLQGSAFLVVKQHTWDNTLSGPVTGNGYRLVLETDLDDVWEGVTPPGSFASGQTIMAQILIETSPDTFEVLDPMTYTVTAGTNGTRFAGPVTVLGLNLGATRDPINGPLLLSPPTDGAGKATFDVTLFGVPTGTRIRINLVAVMVENPSVALDFLFGSRGNWQHAMTEPDLRYEDRTL